MSEFEKERVYTLKVHFSNMEGLCSDTTLFYYNGEIFSKEKGLVESSFLVSPNPVTNGSNILIQYQLYQSSYVSLYLLDASGTLSRMIVSEDEQVGNYRYNYSVGDLRAGEYTLVLKTGIGVFYRKILVSN